MTNPVSVTKPNCKQFVFVRFLKSGMTVLQGHIDLHFNEDNIHFMPYHHVEHFLRAGEAELI